ncbi:PEGA domain-containing protein, partial [Massilia solisilvae]
APVAPATPAIATAARDAAAMGPHSAAATRSIEPEPAASSPARPVAPSAAPARDAQQAPSVTYKLMVKPWGTVYVDGAERGISPPLKHLRLAPGQHTVRVVNPNYRDRVLRIDAEHNRNGRIDVDFGQRSR